MRKLLARFTLAATAVAASLTFARAAPDPPPAATVAPADSAPIDAGLALIQAKCVACHDTGVILGVRRPAKDWRDIINQMIGQGAALTDAEADQVQAYLEKTMSTPPPNS